MAAADDDYEEEGTGSTGVRSFWSGTITFGLVTVPVNLFPATAPRQVAFKMLGPEDAPVRRRYVCSKDGEPLEADDIVRGYEIEKGKFVVVSDDELEAIEPRKSREIDLRIFVDRTELDPMYFVRAYFLTPAGGSNKAYRLLAEVMEKSGRAGIATFVMRAKEYLIAILAENGILRAETLRFHDELRKPEDVGLPDKARPKSADVTKFEKLIASHSGKADFTEMLDDYAKRVEKLVKEKQKKNEGIVRAPELSREDAEEGGGEVIDLLEVLRRSMGPQKAAPARKSPKKATTKKAASTKKAATKKKAPARKRTTAKKKAS
ncbi:MAG TPA: Ku protein [Thermoanaerobaculia bacterium]